MVKKLTAEQSEVVRGFWELRGTPLEQQPLVDLVATLVSLRQMSFGYTSRTDCGVFKIMSKNRKRKWDGTIVIINSETKENFTVSLKVFSTLHEDAKPRVQTRAVYSLHESRETRNNRQLLNERTERNIRTESRKMLKRLGLTVPQLDWLVYNGGKDKPETL